MKRGLFPFLAVALSASAALAGPHDALIAKHAAANGVPEELVRRIIRIESRGNARASHGGNYGLMQIRLATARGVGYAGDAQGLFDPDVNLTYAVKYLAGAYRAAGCNASRAVAYYQRGYYGRPQLGCSAAAAADVIKPKVVRTETIAPSKPGAAPARPAGAFEPVRVTAPVLELASVPMPPARREPVRTPKPVRHGKLAHTGGEQEKKVSADKASGDKDPIGVVTFLKKLVTPDKTARKPASQEEAAMDPPTQVQPPQ